MKRALALTAAAVALCWPLAAAAIGTPTNIGSAQNSSTVLTESFTTTANIAVGDLVVVVFNLESAASSPSVGDSCGQSYTISNIYSGSAGKAFIAYKANSAACATGATITASWTGSARVAMAGATVGGVATSSPIDKNPATGTSGTTVTTVTQATGVLAQANEIIFGSYTTSLSDGGEVTPGGTGWSALTAVQVTGARQLHWAWKVVSSTADSNYSPQWTTARTVSANLWSFEGTGAAPAHTPALMMMGVGR